MHIKVGLMDPVSQAIRAIHDVKNEQGKQTSRITRGNPVELQETPLSDHKEYVSKSTQHSLNLQASERFVNFQDKESVRLELLSKLTISMDNLQGVARRNFPLTQEAADAGIAEAYGALQQVANLLNEFPNVNKNAILDVGDINVAEDGSYNTDYLLSPTPQAKQQLLDGKTFDDAVVPEDFAPLIAGLKLFLRDFRTVPLPQNVSQDAVAAFNEGYNNLVKAASGSKLQLDNVIRDIDEASLRSAESEAAMKKITDFNVNEAAQTMQEKKKIQRILEGLMRAMLRFETDATESLLRVAGG